jgi:hypothetical protein
MTTQDSRLSVKTWNAIVNQASSSENKALLWSILSEENIFAGLNDQSLQPMITLFETAVHTTINSYAEDSAILRSDSQDTVLSNLNKDVMKRVIQDVATYKAQASVQPILSSNTPNIPLYKSTDIQEARIKDITSKVKVLENDMNSFLVLKKPPEIDFSDKNMKDDLPIGDNMDQLIKDALAARERELEIIQFDIPQTTEPNPILTQSKSQGKIQDQIQSTDNNTSIKKTVSFEESSDAELEIGNIFNKLKKPSSPQIKKEVNSVSISNDQFTEVNNKLDSMINSIRELQINMLSMSQEIQFIKTNMFNYEAEPDIMHESAN